MPRHHGTHTLPKIFRPSKEYKGKLQDMSLILYTYDRASSVTKLLQNLSWSSLERRREAHRLTCLYKILHGSLDIDHSSFMRQKPIRGRRGHANQFVIEQISSDVYKFSYFPRTIRSWNNLAPPTISKTDAA